MPPNEITPSSAFQVLAELLGGISGVVKVEKSVIVVFMVTVSYGDFVSYSDFVSYGEWGVYGDGISRELS